MNGNSKAVIHGQMCMVLSIVLLVLKLTNVINWSWWWVTALLWIPASIVLVFFLIFFVIVGIIAMRNIKDILKW